MGVGGVVLQFEISHSWLSIVFALQFPAGIAGRPWNINDTVTTMDASAPEAGRRWPFILCSGRHYAFAFGLFRISLPDRMRPVRH
jgi:hypothetical protein